MKCLQCGWKWWSKRTYVNTLNDHQEYTRPKITDADILDRIRRGDIRCNRRGRVMTRKAEGCVFEDIKILERTQKGTTYKFVEIGYKLGRKKIALHKLVWMYFNNKCVPAGYDVDHIKGKSIEYPDGIDNLRLLTSTRNRSRKYVSPTPELPFGDFEDGGT